LQKEEEATKFVEDQGELQKEGSADKRKGMENQHKEEDESHKDQKNLKKK